MSDIALRKWQIGLESTYGTAVAATRPWYGQGAIKPVSPEPTMRNEDRGSYDAFHRASQPVLHYDWEFSGGLDLDDVVEQLKLAVNSTTTPSGAGPYVWAFTPGNNLASMTAEWDASGKVWELDGCQADTFKLSGRANGEDVELEMSGPGRARADSSLTSLSDHTTNVVQGWELKLYIDGLGDTPGTTEVAGTIISWEVEVVNALTRRHKGDNTRYINALTRGRRMISGNILLCLNSSALTEITNQEAVTERLLRLEIGNNTIISGADKYYMYIDIPCVLKTHEIGEDGEESTVSLEFSSIYDVTNAFAYRFTVQNNRSS